MNQKEKEKLTEVIEVHTEILELHLDLIKRLYRRIQVLEKKLEDK